MCFFLLLLPNNDLALISLVSVQLDVRFKQQFLIFSQDGFAHALHADLKHFILLVKFCSDLSNGTRLSKLDRVVNQVVANLDDSSLVSNHFGGHVY